MQSMTLKMEIKKEKMPCAVQLAMSVSTRLLVIIFRIVTIRQHTFTQTLTPPQHTHTHTHTYTHTHTHLHTHTHAHAHAHTHTHTTNARACMSRVRRLSMATPGNASKALTQLTGERSALRPSRWLRAHPRRAALRLRPACRPAVADRSTDRPTDRRTVGRTNGRTVGRTDG